MQEGVGLNPWVSPCVGKERKNLKGQYDSWRKEKQRSMTSERSVFQKKGYAQQWQILSSGQAKN